MKHLRAYIIVALLAVTASIASAQKGPQSTDNATKPIKGIDVVVQKEPGNIYARQTASPDGHGGYTVDLPGAGSYTISYANGPKKGQTIKQVTVQKAGPVKVSASASSE